jgi:hypothetical protein
MQVIRKKERKKERKACVSASPARCGVASYCFNEMHSRMAMQLRADSTHRRQAVCLQA